MVINHRNKVTQLAAVHELSKRGDDVKVGVYTPASAGRYAYIQKHIHLRTLKLSLKGNY